jgi:DNA-binding MarR family transcriptional regulator
MSSDDEIYGEHIGNYLDSLRYLTNFQQESGLQVIRKEGEVLLLIKLEPGQPVKYYMSKSGMSSRWFNEILKQLLTSKLVVQETCPYDSRRKLLS